MTRAAALLLGALFAVAAGAQDPAWRLAPFTPAQALVTARQLFQQYLAQERLYDWQFGEPAVSVDADAITVTMPFRGAPAGTWQVTFGRAGGIDEHVDMPPGAAR